MDRRTHFSDETVKDRKRRKRKLTRGELETIKNVFRIFDSDDSGHLDRNEFKMCVRSMGVKLEEEEIDFFFRKYNLEDAIPYNIFEKIVEEKFEQKDPLDEVVKAFELFDVDNTRKISVGNLKTTAKELFGEGILTKREQKELEAMITQFDETGDGKINLQEFINIMSEED